MELHFIEGLSSHRSIQNILNFDNSIFNNRTAKVAKMPQIQRSQIAISHGLGIQLRTIQDEDK